MKYLFLLCFLLISALNSFSQTLSFDELITIQKKDIGDLNDYMLSKGWKFHQSQSETESKYGKIQWAFGLDEYDSERAIAWVECEYGTDYPNNLSYTIFNRATYLAIKNRVLGIGMKNINSGVLEDAIYTDYMGTNYVVRILVASVDENTQSTYLIRIWPKDKYIANLRSSDEEPSSDN